MQTSALKPPIVGSWSKPASFRASTGGARRAGILVSAYVPLATIRASRSSARLALDMGHLLLVVVFWALIFEVFVRFARPVFATFFAVARFAPSALDLNASVISLTRSKVTG